MKKLFFLVISIFVLESSFCQIPTDGLIAHYNFSGNSKNTVTNSLHGNVQGCLLYTSPSPRD